MTFGQRLLRFEKNAPRFARATKRHTYNGARRPQFSQIAEIPIRVSSSSQTRSNNNKSLCYVPFTGTDNATATTTNNVTDFAYKHSLLLQRGNRSREKLHELRALRIFTNPYRPVIISSLKIDSMRFVLQQ